MTKYTTPPHIVSSDFNKSSILRDKILFILRYALLAPSTHNTQPWKIKVEEDRCHIFIDLSRQLPEADGLKRDMYISLGAFIANIENASKAYGIFKKIEYSDQKNDLVATVYFSDNKTEGIASRSLLRAMQTRANYRGPFKPISISDGQKKRIANMCEKDVHLSIVTDKVKIENLAKLTSEALREAYRNPRFRKEIGTWIKPNITRQKKGLPGYSLRMPLLTSIILPKIISHKDIGEKLGGLNYKSFITASGVVILSSSSNDKQTWLRIGKTAQKIILSFEEEGISTSIYVAATENKKFNPKVKEVLGLKKEQVPQFLFCVGKPVLPKVYSPRENLKTKLI